MPAVAINGKDVELKEGQEWVVVMNYRNHATNVVIDALTGKTVCFRCPGFEYAGAGAYTGWPFEAGYVIGRHVEFIELIKDVDLEPGPNENAKYYEAVDNETR